MKKYILSILFMPLLYQSCEQGVEDTTSPTVSIQSPITNQYLNEVVTIVVETDDNEGISKVEFYIDDSLYFTDTESPYEYVWNTTQYEDNSEHIVKIISYNNSDNSTTSQPIIYVINNLLARPNQSELYPIIHTEFFTLTYQNDLHSISWSQNNDDDFQYYKLYGSLSQDMSNSTLIHATENRTDTTFIKTVQSSMFYQLAVEDVWGLQSKSYIEFGDYNVELWGVSYSVESTTNLDLMDSGLTGSIPPEIGNLINLEDLQLNSNQLTGSIPPEIFNLPNLVWLRLDDNQLTGEIPEAVCNKTDNCQIILYDNHLCPPYPSCIEYYVGEQDITNCD